MSGDGNGERRGRGEGNIKQMPNGTFKARMSYVDGQGKRHQPTAYFETKKKALAWLHEQHAKHDRGQLADSGRRTVGAWLAEWLTMKKPQVEVRSWDNWESHVRLHLAPIIGRTPLAKLRPSHVAAMYSTLEEQGVSSAMRKKVGVTLSMAMADAVRMQYLASNPATAIKKPKTKEPDIRPLDAEQARAFLTATATDRLHALYVLALDTGMRQGELFGLHWPEIDFASGVVTIKQSLEERDGHHRLKEPKTASSRRRIEVTPATIAALNAHRQQMLKAGLYRPDGPVFVDTEGNWLRKSNVRRRSFAKALKKAGLPPVRFHDLRHTAATLMLLSGINVKAVAATLGHSKASTTLNIYAHKLPMMDKERVNAMQRILAAG
ncbi:MAG TPA: tyrosine-type recombinase/integrase [Gemmataceae bacterium]|jgi:integrase